MNPLQVNITKAQARAKKRPFGIVKPRTCFTFYLQAYFKEYRKTGKKISLEENVKIIAQMWMNTPPNEKQPFIQMWEEDKVRYVAELNFAKRLLSCPPTPPSTVRQQSNSKRQVKIPGMPLKPLTPFMWYCHGNRSIVRGEMPVSSTLIEISEELGRRWNGFTEEQRWEYDYIAEADRNRYIKELEEFAKKRKLE